MFYILETAPPAGGDYTQIIFLVAIIAIFYFFMIRPQTKKRKEMINFRSNLSKGDEVITQGGIHGNISSVAENTVNLNIDGNTKIKVEKEMVFPNSSSINK
tara:strand:+ start:41 stop:343 length:303 start_codon:yes stop_codon:yes gene_type:complete